jgi:hypothetical protein
MGKPAAELVKDLVERILGPAADAKGQALKEWIEQRKQRGADRIFEAAALLLDAGIEPQPVPGRILLPFLEHASLQDQPELQRKWAALLTNAATPGFQEILPGYVQILGQLTPVQAQILDWLHERRTPHYENVGDLFPDTTRWQIQERFALDNKDYNILIGDLQRLQVIEPPPNMLGDESSQTTWTSPTLYLKVRFTPLGIAFIAACQPPARGGDPDNA